MSSYPVFFRSIWRIHAFSDPRNVRSVWALTYLTSSGRLGSSSQAMWRRGRRHPWAEPFMPTWHGRERYSMRYTITWVYWTSDSYFFAHYIRDFFKLQTSGCRKVNSLHPLSFFFPSSLRKYSPNPRRNYVADRYLNITRQYLNLYA